MDTQTRAAFVAHIQELETRAIDGDEFSARSLACMALLVEGCGPEDPGAGEIVDLLPFLKMAA